MSAPQDPPARDALRTHLEPLLPKRWQLVWSERAADDVGKTRCRISQTGVRRHPQAPGAHVVVFTATVTVPSDDLDEAEAKLDDELEQLLWALDAINVGWGDATKDSYSNRLGYRFELTVPTYRKKG